MLEQMNPDGLMIDASIGSILPGGVQYAIKSGLKAYRLNMRAGLSGEIIAALETNNLYKKLKRFYRARRRLKIKK